MTNLIERRTYPLRDGTLSALHFGRTANPLKLVFLHANGFNAQAYAQILGPLGVHAVAFDMRGHGQSALPTDVRALTGWQIFRDDCVEFFDRYVPDLAPGKVVLAGHSFGAVSGILSAPALKDRISGYVGFDPVSLPKTFGLTSVLPGGRTYMKKRLPIARNAGRRKNAFDSPDAAFERYQGRGAFRGMPDAVLMDYLTGGLQQQPDGQWQLACDPAWEQAIFVAQWHDQFKAARDLPDHSKIMYAGKYSAVSTKGTRGLMQKRQPKISVTYDAELAHLFPLHDTVLATRTLRDVITRAALG